MNKYTLILLITILALSGSLFADSKGEVKPFNETPPAPVIDKKALSIEIRAELEKEYRAEMEKQLAFAIKRDEDSLTNLWVSNSVVWGVFLIFIAAQVLSAKKRTAELSRLKAMKEN